jgi:hypothetical protein
MRQPIILTRQPQFFDLTPDERAQRLAPERWRSWRGRCERPTQPDGGND